MQVFSGEQPWESEFPRHSDLMAMRISDKKLIPGRPRKDYLKDGHWDFMRWCWKQEPVLRPTAKMALEAMEQFVEACGN